MIAAHNYHPCTAALFGWWLFVPVLPSKVDKIRIFICPPDYASGGVPALRRTEEGDCARGVFVVAFCLLRRSLRCGDEHAPLVPAFPFRPLGLITIVPPPDESSITFEPALLALLEGGVTPSGSRTDSGGNTIGLNVVLVVAAALPEGGPNGDVGPSANAACNFILALFLCNSSGASVSSSPSSRARCSISSRVLSSIDAAVSAFAAF